MNNDPIELQLVQFYEKYKKANRPILFNSIVHQGITKNKHPSIDHIEINWSKSFEFRNHFINLLLFVGDRIFNYNVEFSYKKDITDVYRSLVNFVSELNLNILLQIENILNLKHSTISQKRYKYAKTVYNTCKRQNITSIRKCPDDISDNFQKLLDKIRLNSTFGKTIHGAYCCNMTRQSIPAYQNRLVIGAHRCIFWVGHMYTSLETYIDYLYTINKLNEFKTFLEEKAIGAI